MDIKAALSSFLKLFSMQSVLAIAAVVSLLACLYMLCYGHMPDGVKDAFLVIVGVIGGAYKDVYGFFFGSSQGSERKTEILAQQNGTPPAA